MTKRTSYTELSQTIDAFEKKYDYDMNYARELVDVDPLLYSRFFEATQLARYSGGLPPAAHWAVQALGVILGGCGPCVQLSVQLGEEAGVDPSIVRADVSGDFDSLSEDGGAVSLFGAG